MHIVFLAALALIQETNSVELCFVKMFSFWVILVAGFAVKVGTSQPRNGKLLL